MITLSDLYDLVDVGNKVELKKIIDDANRVEEYKSCKQYWFDKYEALKKL